MNTQNNNDRGTEPVRPATTTPTNYSTQDHSFTLQLIMELQRSIGQVAESVAQGHRDSQRIESKLDTLDASMTSVKVTITVAGVVLAIIIAISGFFIDKAWDVISNHVEISVKK